MFSIINTKEGQYMKLSAVVKNYRRKNGITASEFAEREFALLEEDAADKTLLMALQAEYRQVSAKVENILEAIEQGIFTPKTKERLLELESRQTELEDRIVREKLKKPEFTVDHIVYWLTKFRQGDIKDFEFRRAVINALVNSVFVYDDDTDPNKKGRIIIALNLKNGPVKTLTRSDVHKMGHHFKRNANFCRIQRYTAVFFIASRNAGISIDLGEI